MTKIEKIDERYVDTPFIERLKFAISGGSVLAFAKKSSVAESTLRHYLKGGMPSLENIILISRAANVSLDWLARGLGEMRPRDTSLDVDKVLNGLPVDFRLVPQLDMHASAGSGWLNHAEDHVGFMAFQSSWLVERGINPSFARILNAVGDSMEPTIRDGDLLLVDTSIDQLINHGIYVLIHSGLLLVKRVTRRIDGSILIRSDNRSAYDDEIISADKAIDLVIAGRVRWAGRTF